MKSDAENSDTQPIIVPDIVEAESPHPSPSTSSKKWAIIGGTLALTASLVYAFTGLLIKTFKLDFVDTLFVRSTLQTIFLFALIKVRKIPILLTFAEPEDQKYKIKKYCILIFQVRQRIIFRLMKIKRRHFQNYFSGNMFRTANDVFLSGHSVLSIRRCNDSNLQWASLYHALFLLISKNSSRLMENIFCLDLARWSYFSHQTSVHVSQSSQFIHRRCQR